jgi:hypothetical protein
MTAQELADAIGTDLVRGVHERGGRTFIVTRFEYLNGDSIPLYPESRGGEVFVSDLGTTMFACLLRRRESADRLSESIRDACERHGVIFDQGVLRKRVRPDDARADCLAFCQAATDVSRRWGGGGLG